MSSTLNLALLHPGVRPVAPVLQAATTITPATQVTTPAAPTVPAVPAAVAAPAAAPTAAPAAPAARPSPAHPRVICCNCNAVISKRADLRHRHWPFCIERRGNPRGLQWDAHPSCRRTPYIYRVTLNIPTANAATTATAAAAPSAATTAAATTAFAALPTTNTAGPSAPRKRKVRDADNDDEGGEWMETAAFGPPKWTGYHYLDPANWSGRRFD